MFDSLLVLGVVCELSVIYMRDIFMMYFVIDSEILYIDVLTAVFEFVVFLAAL